MAKELIKSDIAIRTTKPKDKPFRIRDGLYMLVQPNGAKWWLLDYTFECKRKTLSLGVYDRVTLKRAREKARKAWKLIDRG